MLVSYNPLARGHVTLLELLVVFCSSSECPADTPVDAALCRPCTPLLQRETFSARREPTRQALSSRDGRSTSDGAGPPQAHATGRPGGACGDAREPEPPQDETTTGRREGQAAHDARRRIALRLLRDASISSHRLEGRPAGVPLQGRRLDTVIRVLQDRVLRLLPHAGAVDPQRDRPEARAAMYGRVGSDGSGPGRRVSSPEQPELRHFILRRRADLPDPRESKNRRDGLGGSSFTIKEIVEGQVARFDTTDNRRRGVAADFYE